MNSGDANCIGDRLICVWMFTSIFGMVVELKLMSKKDSLVRKKYMGMCRWESEIMAWMMCRFPSTAIRYMDRSSLYMRV
jgi:hypothetical protein